MDLCQAGYAFAPLRVLFVWVICIVLYCCILLICLLHYPKVCMLIFNESLACVKFWVTEFIYSVMYSATTVIGLRWINIFKVGSHIVMTDVKHSAVHGLWTQVSFYRYLLTVMLHYSWSRAVITCHQDGLFTTVLKKHCYAMHLSCTSREYAWSYRLQ